MFESQLGHKNIPSIFGLLVLPLTNWRSYKALTTRLGAWLIKMAKLAQYEVMRSDLHPRRGAIICRLGYRQD